MMNVTFAFRKPFVFCILVFTGLLDITVSPFISSYHVYTRLLTLKGSRALSTRYIRRIVSPLCRPNAHHETYLRASQVSLEGVPLLT